MVESKENCKFDLGVKGLVNLQQGQIFTGEQIQKGLVRFISSGYRIILIDIWRSIGVNNFEWISFEFYSYFLQGIILVYDITRQETFNNIRKWLRYVDEVSVTGIFLTFCPSLTC